MDKLLLIGVNHKVAPVALRERLAFTPEGVVQALKTLRARLPGDAEVGMLSTCNRTEIILRATEPCQMEETGRDFLSKAGHFSGETLTDVLYIHRGCEAARHLLRVAAGLDSLVVGENEIQGQVRTASKLAQSAGTSGPFLNTLFRMAVQNGKRVRAETDIGKTKLSVASVVVELATEQFGDLRHYTALLIGAGKISTLTARELVRAGLRCVLVANRTFERAQQLVQSLGTEYASAVHFDRLDEKLAVADIVICSTGAPHIVLHSQAVADAMESRPERPLLVADLAIPRDADPAIADIPNAGLYSIDDLSGLVQERHPVTAEAWREAEVIVEEGLSVFAEWCETRHAVPLIRSLRANANAIVQAETESTLQRLGPLSVEQQAAIEHLGQAIVNKLLHEPICCLKNRPEIIQQSDTFELVQALFGLDSPHHSSNAGDKI
jgi:glutamyl-tRNA reductase